MVSAHDPDLGRRPPARGLIARQVVYQLRILVRSPMGSFATLVIPLMVLLAVNLLFRGTRLYSRGGVQYVQFFTPAMMAFAVVNACYMSVIVSTTLARDEGILKRIRSTPLPTWVYMAGRVIAAGLVAAISAIVVAAVGAGVYGFQVIWSSVPAAVVTLGAAVFCFCALGFAVTVLVPKADSALPVAWGTILPLCFISDVFQPIDGAPHWLQTIASVFPLRPFADALELAFNPVSGTHAIQVAVVLKLLAWGMGAAIFAIATFRWEPRERGLAGWLSETPLGRLPFDHSRDLTSPGDPGPVPPRRGDGEDHARPRQRLSDRRPGAGARTARVQDLSSRRGRSR